MEKRNALLSMDQALADNAFVNERAPSMGRTPMGRVAEDGPTYRVQRGDSLWRIAKRLLGDGRRWKDIWALNRGAIADPDLIHPGQMLVLPQAPAGVADRR